ncbi:MAG: Gfo/Idh/MocA family oxidoreductase [bacterium]
MKIGIIGTGVMGTNHLRVAKRTQGVEVSSIYDVDNVRAQKAADQFGITASSSIDELCACSDAVIIVTPAFTHAEIAMQCLKNNCHVLLEKPIDVDVNKAQELTEYAKKSKCILMIAHIERFNPAFQLLKQLLINEHIIALDFQRLATSLGRDKSADIILDLMIHDIDLALALTNSTGINVQAAGICGKNTHNIIDYARASVIMNNGILCSFTASGISQERFRKIRAYTVDKQYDADLNTREITITTMKSSSIVDKITAIPISLQVEKFSASNNDALQTEISEFVNSISNGLNNAAGAEEGLEALKLANKIQYISKGTHQ